MNEQQEQELFDACDKIASLLGFYPDAAYRLSDLFHAAKVGMEHTGNLEVALAEALHAAGVYPPVEQAAIDLELKRIGFGEFHRIVRENTQES